MSSVIRYHSPSSDVGPISHTMAAISALMIGQGSTDNEKPDVDPPTTPRPVVRVQSPGPQDIATIDRPSSTSPEPRTDLPPDTGGTTPSNISPQEPDDGTRRAGPKRRDSQAMDVEDSADEQDGSDNDGDQGDGTSSARKKKGQRFFCTGYPPCNLSFTRSEHLARHIRKHTGERPFQCHCNRRFSRLDNLRQHAQTVHAMEDIPTDSLAATGTRYQRQIRTDRVRPSPRPRTSTMSSSGSHSRGHSRNLSTSSIGSTSSIYSNATDVRRRPPPLLMAGENRPSTPPTYANYSAHSPGDLNTPTSSTFAATPGSPNFSSVLGSPVSAMSRPTGYPADARIPARRLSVPSSVHPYHSPYSSQFGAQYGPGPAVSNSASIVTSPTTSNFAPGANTHGPPGEDWRRRTWHPSTYSNLNPSYTRPATSGLTYSQTPDAPQPAYAQNAMSATGQAPRLPGIESFDHVQHRPTTPPRRGPTPPSAQNKRPQALLAAPDIEGPRRGHAVHASWDGSRPSQYPDIDENGRPAPTWAQQTLEQLDMLRDAQARRQSAAQPVMGPPPHANSAQQTQQIAKEALDLQSSASKRVKRTGWYSGQSQPQRTSPDSSSSDGIPTPGTSAAEINPVIMHSNGFIEPQLLGGDAQHTVSRGKQIGSTQS